jgi:hypothetical protein
VEVSKAGLFIHPEHCFLAGNYIPYYSPSFNPENGKLIVDGGRYQV